VPGVSVCAHTLAWMRTNALEGSCHACTHVDASPWQPSAAAPRKFGRCACQDYPAAAAAAAAAAAVSSAIIQAAEEEAARACRGAADGSTVAEKAGAAATEARAAAEAQGAAAEGAAAEAGARETGSKGRPCTQRTGIIKERGWADVWHCRHGA